MLSQLRAVAEKLGMKVYVNERPRVLHSIQIFDSAIVVYFYYFTPSMYPCLLDLIALLRKSGKRCEIAVNSDALCERALPQLLRLGFAPDASGDLILTLN